MSDFPTVEQMDLTTKLVDKCLSDLSHLASSIDGSYDRLAEWMFRRLKSNAETARRALTEVEPALFEAVKKPVNAWWIGPQPSFHHVSMVLVEFFLRITEDLSDLEDLPSKLKTVSIDYLQAALPLESADAKKAIRTTQPHRNENDLVCVRDLVAVHKLLDPSGCKKEGTFRAVLKAHKPITDEKDGKHYYGYPEIRPTLQKDDRVKVVGGDDWPKTVRDFREILRRATDS